MPPTADVDPARLAAAAARVREWFRRRVDAQALDLARLYQAHRDVFIARLRTVYEQFLAGDPTYRAALSGPGGPALAAAVQDTAAQLARELGELSIQRLAELRGWQGAVLQRHLGRWTGLTWAALPPSTQAVLGEVTTTVVAGGTFLDRVLHVTTQLRDDLATAVRQSLLNGEDFWALRRRVHRAFGVDRLAAPDGPAYGAVQTYRNEALRQWNRLMGAQAEATGGTEVWWAIVEGPDARTTTPGCAARHARPLTDVGDRPPRHYNCRCQVIVVPPGTDLRPERAKARAWLSSRGWTLRTAQLQEAQRLAPLVTAEWDPAEHPRDPATGRFVPRVGGERDAAGRFLFHHAGPDADALADTGVRPWQLTPVARGATRPPDEALAYADQAFPITQPLSSGETKALREYQNFGYQRINAELRKGTPNWDAPVSQYRDWSVGQVVRALDRRILQSSAQQDTVVFRQANMRELLANVKPGDELVDRGYVSTSLVRAIAERFGGGEMVQILIPKGLPAFSYDAAGIRQKGASEGEVLLPRGSRFRVVDVGHNIRDDADPDEALRTGWGKMYVVLEYLGPDPAAAPAPPRRPRRARPSQPAPTEADAAAPAAAAGGRFVWRPGSVQVVRRRRGADASRRSGRRG